MDHVMERAAPTAEEFRFGFAGLAEPTAPAQVEIPKAASPVVRWLTDKPRTSSYALDFPFEIDGVEYRSVTIRRLTAGEVAAFYEKLRTDPASAKHLPMYFVDDVPVADAAWDVMDDDDRVALSEVAESFLPARFRLRTENPQS